MSFAYWLESNVPPVLLCSTLIIVSALLAIGGALITQKFVHHSRLKRHNDISGPIFSTLGVIYAVLLAFTVIINWQKFDSLSVNTGTEASLLTSLYVNAESFEPSFKVELRKDIGIYIKEIINEWGMIGAKRDNPAGTKAIENILKLYSSYSVKNETEKIFLADSIIKANKLFDLRMQRFVESNSGVHNMLWFVLIVGAIITIAFTIFFGSESLAAKMAMSTLLAVLIALVLYTILEFSYPFSGGTTISNQLFKDLVLRFGL